MIANYIFSRKSVVRCHALGGRFCRTAESNDYRNSVAMATCVLDNLDLWYLYYLYHVCCQHKTLDSSPPMSMQVLRTCTVTCHPRVSTSIHGSTHIVHTMHSCVCVSLHQGFWSAVGSCRHGPARWQDTHQHQIHALVPIIWWMCLNPQTGSDKPCAPCMDYLPISYPPPHFSNVDFL